MYGVSEDIGLIPKMSVTAQKIITKVFHSLIHIRYVLISNLSVHWFPCLKREITILIGFVLMRM